MSIPRPEHPRPQFERQNWQNLNGRWDFEFDNQNSAIDRGLYKNDAVLSQKITVPFCPESKLSGLAHTDFINGCVYRREFDIPAEWLDGATVLHFGACDYIATVFVNEQEVGRHIGGYVSFEFDISDYVKEGKNTLSVVVKDDTRDEMIPSGKQCFKYESFGCHYTRTTGIWQTVWVENMPKEHIISTRYYTDIHTGTLTVIAKVKGVAPLTVKALYKGEEMGIATALPQGETVTVSIPLKEKHLWEIGNGRLYDLQLTYGEDAVKSYFGLREVSLNGYKFMLNGKSVYLRTVRDQGFYPDGIYTAPTDADLEKDIQMALDCGFNGARPHEKIFEERYFYYADKMGYLTFGEYPDWSLNHTKPQSVYHILPEWLEEIERDFNKPSIIGWCPHNEAWGPTYHEGLRLVYLATKAADLTRPCIDSSGGGHVQTDIYDSHYYAATVEEFKNAYDGIKDGQYKEVCPGCVNLLEYKKDIPFFVSEYGGIAFNRDGTGWGCGDTPQTEDDVIARFKAQTEYLLGNDHICGLCYTQLTDVEQEQNGLYYYDRTPKFNNEKFKAILTQKAAIED
ncbi:MAG: beta-galactosidase [Oscillospiraceae bacterium]|nr:beta-galactosidase [Candidatus Equicaccousia limihippi]